MQLAYACGIGVGERGSAEIKGGYKMSVKKKGGSKKGGSKKGGKKKH